jgi:hypothetical protein
VSDDTRSAAEVDTLEMQNAAAEIKLRAERRAGEMLAQMEKHNGDPRSRDVTRVSDLGISKMQSHRWQLEARDCSAQETGQAAARSVPRLGLE